MATNFSSEAYVAALQTLLDRHEVGVVVSGFRAGRDYDKIDEPIAELMIDSLPVTATGGLRELDGILSGALLVMRRLNDDEAEAHAFELALDVATALVDEVALDELGEPVAPPVMAAGPIRVTGIEPEQPDGALRSRTVGYLVTFEQAWRIRRTNQPAEPAPLTHLRVGRSPADVDDYVELVPVPYPTSED